MIKIKKQTTKPSFIIAIARLLRKNQTPVEEILWENLRDRKLRGHKIRRQHPLIRYVPDFYCAEVKLAIEIDGKIHERMDVKEYDQARQEAIESLELKVMRVKNKTVYRNLDKVLTEIGDTLEGLRAKK